MNVFLALYKFGYGLARESRLIKHYFSRDEAVIRIE